MSDVTITMPENIARSVLRAVQDDPDRSKWGHHQHDRGIAVQAIWAALNSTEAGDDIPAEVSALLDEVYPKLHHRNWWEMSNRLFDNRPPCEVYAEDPDRVLGVLHGLAEGVAT